MTVPRISLEARPVRCPLVSPGGKQAHTPQKLHLFFLLKRKIPKQVQTATISFSFPFFFCSFSFFFFFFVNTKLKRIKQLQVGK